MKRLLLLLALVAGMAFAGCSDDEEVKPDMAEQIAAKIASFTPKQVNIHSDRLGTYNDASYKIEIPFLIIENESDNHVYLRLDNLIRMWYVSGTLYLYFG